MTQTSNPVSILLLFETILLASNVTRGHEAAAPDRWTDQAIENAFHDVLVHGDLSDIEFLQKTLGLTFEVVQWEQPSQFEKETIETHAAATGVPSYLHPYGIAYTLERKTTENTSQVRVGFDFQSCRGLSGWGIDWNQEVKMSDSMDPHGAADVHMETIRWQQDGAGIALSVTSSAELCIVELEQKKQGALSIPKPPRLTPPGPGTELLEQVIDLVAAGELRDYRRTARILHTDMSTYGKLRGHYLYDGSAIPDRLNPGTNSLSFRYSANDTGWISADPFIYVPRRVAKTVQLWIPVDTFTHCISPESLESRLRQRHIRFEKQSDPNRGSYLRALRRDNALSMSYSLAGPCINELRLNQETDFMYSPQ